MSFPRSEKGESVEPGTIDSEVRGVDLRNCARCNNIFRPIGGHRFCPDCVEKDRKEFETVRDYLKNHANATMMQIAKGTGVSTAKIREYIREGRLVVASDDTGLQCESCGKPLRQGRFCPECIAQMKEEVRRGVRTGPKPEPAKPQRNLGEIEEKQYVWNRFRRR